MPDSLPSGLHSPAVSSRHGSRWDLAGTDGGADAGPAAPLTPSERNAAAAGHTDPTGLRRWLRAQRAAADTAAFNRAHDHPGVCPYRVVLGEVGVGREKQNEKQRKQKGGGGGRGRLGA